MKWSDRLRAFGRGIKLSTRIAQSRLAKRKLEQRRAPSKSDRLIAFDDFGANPGSLRMLSYQPSAVGGRPLTVLLHGCGQDAARFAADSGWMELADRLHVPLVLPQQAEANNVSRCFQWYRRSATARDRGEAGSVAAMIRTAIARFESDPNRVFVVGLSAGGAMAAALLAAYPDLFAAGASVAGLPVGTARSGMQALLRMASPGPDQSPKSWADRARAAAPRGYAGPWPRLSVWQGQADTIVAPANATLLVTQWRALHGLTAPAVLEQVQNGVLHRTWPDRKHRLVELWSLPGLPHAYPVGTRVVAPGHFVESAPVDATAGIARFFGLD
ncbi:MAG TPA: PHB depolymerase family esterase [Rhodopila sp.]